MPPKTFKRKVLSPLMASDVQIAANNKRQRLNLQGSRVVTASASKLPTVPEATQGNLSIQHRIGTQLDLNHSLNNGSNVS